VTDQQVLTLAIAIVLPLSMLLYSNSRITEAKETLRAEIRRDIMELRLEMNERFNSIDRKLDELLRLVAQTTIRELPSWKPARKQDGQQTPQLFQSPETKTG
jgi:hypothetical protein